MKNGKLEVVFRSLKTDAEMGRGFYMPSKEFFNNIYVPEHFPNAISIGDGKYQIDDYRYIMCE